MGTFQDDLTVVSWSNYSTTKRNEGKEGLCGQINMLKERYFDPKRTAFVDALFLFSEEMVNGQCVMIMVPDGSKEYWSTSDLCNQIRCDIIDFVRNNPNIYSLINISWGELGVFASFNDPNARAISFTDRREPALRDRKESIDSRSNRE